MRWLAGWTVALGLGAAATPAAALHPHARPDDAPSGLFVGLAGGATVPLGDWAAGTGATAGEPRGAPDILAGAGGGAIAGWAPAGSRLFALQSELGYARLGTRGPDGSAGLWSFAVGGLLDLPGRGDGPYALELHGALGVVAPVGGPDGGGRYDFFSSTLFGRTGARLVARLENGFETYLGVDLLTAPGGVDHPGREKQTILGLEPSLGLRYWFGR
jgi:hypothetical protein